MNYINITLCYFISLGIVGCSNQQLRKPASELAVSNNNRQTQSDTRECSWYNQSGGLENDSVPVGTECIIKEDNKEKGRFKKTTITLKDGTRVRALEIVGTNIIMEFAMKSNLCQTDTITRRNGYKQRLDNCFDQNGNSLGAEQYCASRGLKLPTSEDFVLALRRGFKEAFNGDMNSKYFWSSSYMWSESFPLPGHMSDSGINSYQAYIFLAPGGGSVSTSSRNHRSELDSARCVSATGQN